MLPSSFPSSLLFLKAFLFLSSFLSTIYASSVDERYSACTPFDCGNFKGISYPVWGNNLPNYCGHPKFKLDCGEDNVTITILSLKFLVLDINYGARLLTIARMDLLGSVCPHQYANTTLDFSFLDYTAKDMNSTLLYDCDPSAYPGSVNFTCLINNVRQDAYFVLTSNPLVISSLSCTVSIIVPILMVENQSIALLNPLELIDKGFEVRWEADQEKCEDCRNSGGRCGHNTSMNEFTCFCSDQPYSRACPNNTIAAAVPAPASLSNENAQRHGIDWGRKIIVAVSAASASAIIVCTLFVVYLRHYKKWHFVSSRNFKSMSSHMSSLKDPEKGSKHFGLHVFTYSELEEATDNFNSSRELGDGGFGTVYYGKLQDGRCVAVKRLYENNCRRVEQFMNEVAILTHLRHPNLVSLYGSTSRHSRELLLVYEYIPNGTVADHLHGERAKPSALTWPIRLNIAIETASALAYLHASDIIHRDVKTTNILLDENFCVKVVDFGLSRLFPNDVTHISTAPQGTPGYVDPEYHECYQLTDKSDVYSFGVVLIELISSKPAVDITRHRHEINLANMAINKIQNQALHELVDPCLGFESDCKVRKMINAVAELAFQCLQNLKDLRPQMKEVLESLKDIKGDGHNKGEAEVMDISEDDTMLLRNTLPSPSQSPM